MGRSLKELSDARPDVFVGSEEEEADLRVRAAVEGCLRVISGNGLSFFEGLIVVKLLLKRIIGSEECPTAALYLVGKVVDELKEEVPHG